MYVSQVHLEHVPCYIRMACRSSRTIGQTRNWYLYRNTSPQLTYNTSLWPDSSRKALLLEIGLRSNHRQMPSYAFRTCLPIAFAPSLGGCRAAEPPPGRRQAAEPRGRATARGGWRNAETWPALRCAMLFSPQAEGSTAVDPSPSAAGRSAVKPSKLAEGHTSQSPRREKLPQTPGDLKI
jgi:hypothetical protein